MIYKCSLIMDLPDLKGTVEDLIWIWNNILNPSKTE